MQTPAVDVAVAGCGPVGLVLTALLGRQGLSVVAVDPAPEPYPHPRAIALDDEVLRTLVRLPGLTGLLGQVNGLQRAGFVGPDRRLITEIAFGETELGLPGLAFFEQPALERDLRAGVAGLPSVELRLGRAVTGIRQEPEGVDVDLDDGSCLRASWLVGADGAASPTRRLLGVPYAGRTAAQPWLVVDVATDRPLPHLPYFSYVCDPRRPSVNMPSPGGHRFEWMLLPGEDPDRMVHPEVVRELLRADVDPGLVRVVRSAVYRYSAREARSWRVGRVLLAGDAAHSMPPFAGQGLGAGVRDAVALAWCLGEVVSGRAGTDLLDGYEKERRPHVRAVTRTARLAGLVLQTTNPAASALARAGLHALDRAPVAGPWFRAGGARPRPARPRQLPNPRVRTLDGRVRRLDDLLGAGWGLLAEGRDPTGALTPAAAGWVSRRAATVLAVVPPGGLRTVAGVACPVAEDLDGTLLRLLRRRARRPPAVVLVRPDRRLAALPPEPCVG